MSRFISKIWFRQYLYSAWTTSLRLGTLPAFTLRVFLRLAAMFDFLSRPSFRLVFTRYNKKLSFFKQDIPLSSGPVPSTNLCFCHLVHARLPVDFRSSSGQRIPASIHLLRFTYFVLFAVWYPAFRKRSSTFLFDSRCLDHPFFLIELTPSNFFSISFGRTAPKSNPVARPSMAPWLHVPWRSSPPRLIRRSALPFDASYGTRVASWYRFVL